MKANKKNVRTTLAAVFCVALILLFIWILLVKFEGENPSVSIDLMSPYVGKSHKMSVTVSDVKSGIKKIWIGLTKDGKEVVVFEKEFPRGGVFGAGRQHQVALTVSIDPMTMGISDGQAILRMVARDFSWRKWWNGNRTYVEKEVTIDTKPPGINILSRSHNVSQGGTGLVAYKLSEPCRKSGVYVGHNFFPGHSGHFKDRTISLAFFAVEHDQDPRSELFLEATDFGGNASRSEIPHYLKRKVFRKDTIEIPESFLKRKLVEFDTHESDKPNMSLIDKFLQINRDLRSVNHKQIEKLSEKTDIDMYWHGAFLRLPNSARKSAFADDRTYTYKGRVVDHQVHLGIDLASVAHSPVPAANGGKVVFAGDLGIYGKTVMLDHGLGLFSTYSHLSALNTTPGQMVSRGDIIGHTGSTGLAGGDHLHFGILVHDTFVNPVEWWDDMWIKHNVLDKIDDIASTQ